MSLPCWSRVACGSSFPFVSSYRPQLQPGDPSPVDLNFLADPLDRTRLMEGVRLARRIGRTAPLTGRARRLGLVFEGSAAEMNSGPAQTAEDSVPHSAQ